MKEIIIALIFASIILGTLSLNVFLIYKSVEGWGWFLFVSTLVIGGIRMRTD
jgi:hypothetical protein